jgi:hypothetical protein
MRCMCLAVATVFAAALSFPAKPQANPQPFPQDRGTSARTSITVPASTDVSLALVRPLWMKSAKSGEEIYAMTAFPVSADNQMAIPAGTYVSGVVDALTKPGRFSSHAEVRIHFTKLVFANGYTVLLDTEGSTAISNLRVQVSFNSDVLLDNGAPMEMLLTAALPLDAERAADASRISKAPQLAEFRTASRCVPVAGTSGSPATVIPGTPGTPGTPPTVIPGGPGFPPTVIPGTPGTPGTPATVIPGSSGTLGVACPAPPVVMQAPSPATADHVKSFRLTVPLFLAGTPLTPGTYRVAWSGPGPEAPVDVTHNGKLVVHTHAHIVTLGNQAESDNVESSTGADGTLVLKTVRFAGDTLELSFAE